MLQLLKTAALGMILCCGMYGHGQAVSVQEIQAEPQRYILLSRDKGMNLYIDKYTVNVHSEGKTVRIFAKSLVVPHNMEMIGEYTNDIIYNPKRSSKEIVNEVLRKNADAYKNKTQDFEDIASKNL